MSKAVRNFWIDIVLFVQVVSMAATGIIMKWVLPPGSGGGHGWAHGGRGWGRGHDGFGPRTLLGMTRHDWGDVHFWVSVSLVAMLLLHLVLHWRWIVCRLKTLVSVNRGLEPRCDGEDDEVARSASFRSSARPSGAAGFHRG